jgi:hypothetical protein
MKCLVPALLLAGVLATPAHGATLARLDGIGPLKLGMSSLSALDTGWLGDKQTGCKLGGKPYPVDYTLTGAKAPKGISASAEFDHGKLANITFSKGVRTAAGVVPGITSWPSMVKRYRDRGFKVSARYDEVFVGTFVNVKRKHGGALVMTGFAEKGKSIGMIGVPYIPLCE